MAYSIALFDLQGQVVLHPAPFASATARWELDGPGSLEVSLREHQVGSAWLPGRRRVELRGDGVAIWGGWLLSLEASFDPDEGATYTARALGHAAPLDGRVVLGDFSRMAVATSIAWDLVQHAQSQPNGDLGITLGTVVGTAPALARHYCDGDSIREAIDELASREPGGFDWEVDAARKLNMWVGGRGADKTAQVSFGPEQVRELDVGWDGSELATYADALGADPDGPCGPAVVTRVGALAGTYLRRDVVVEADTSDAGELAARADQELAVRARARLRLRATIEEGHDPAGLASLELGDRVSAMLPAVFGGVQPVKVISRSVSLESRAIHHWEYEFEAAS